MDTCLLHDEATMSSQNLESSSSHSPPPPYCVSSLCPWTLSCRCGQECMDVEGARREAEWEAT